jgi:hypothetical protein
MRKVSLLGIALLVTLGLLVPMARPAMAWEGISTIVTITASATQVSPGDWVDLTITETKDGGGKGLEPAWVDLTAPSLALIKLDQTSTEYGFASTIDLDAVLEFTETWTWTVPVQVNEDTTFTATGHGISWDGFDITPPLDPDEEDSVTVTVTENGGEGLTPGYWKRHTDEWPFDAPGPYFDDVFGAGPHVTIEKALKTGGGGCKALVRHAAAAYLSILHSEVDYPIGEGALVSLVYDALVAEECESLKDELDGYNNLGCPELE